MIYIYISGCVCIYVSTIPAPWVFWVGPPLAEVLLLCGAQRRCPFHALFTQGLRAMAKT